jgi:hypothetical protein
MPRYVWLGELSFDTETQGIGGRTAPTEVCGELIFDSTMPTAQGSRPIAMHFPGLMAGLVVTGSQFEAASAGPQPSARYPSLTTD